ncbi:hypothetical protein [Sphingomonas sp. SORGH_AS_0879]|uniref:hypothetical protein n=1 Tax=Sphingomonas sp. SORGH_AS_0879 TaxID=3041790 RepID=UPI002784EB86|nr:hypothetical protein [Sphingomonas sp. SORGH_AS_0879]MDQ1232112.1 hypothetical protein [Sphingomonas sp. SORGH_AS_0879]
MLEEAANRAFGVTVTPDQGHMAGYGDFDRAVAVIGGLNALYRSMGRPPRLSSRQRADDGMEEAV